MQHNKMVNSAKLDLDASKMAVWETISEGLPQFSSSAGFQDNIKQAIFLIPDFFGGDLTKKIPVTFGSQFNASLMLQGTVPIFNAP